MKRCRKHWKMLLVLIASMLLTALAGQAQDALLVVAHGSSAPGWNELVLRTANQVTWPGPVEGGFLMQAPPENALDQAVARLEKAGVERIIVVPLLVSSFSGHYEEIRYYAGARQDAPGHVHGAPLETKAELMLAPAMDDHPLVSEILADYARSLSQQPSQESLVLVAHGPNEDAENEKWLQSLRSHARWIGKQMGFRRIEVVTLRDDAPQAIRDAATEHLRAVVHQAAEDSKVLVVPVLISVGDIQRKIRERLDGLPYIMSEKGLLEHSLAVEWIRQQALRSRNATTAEQQAQPQ